MTNALVLAATYNKRPLKLTTDGAVDPDKLTRELGNIEAALRIPVAATGGYFTLTDPQWGGDPNGRRDNSAAMRKILGIIASGLTPIRAIYAPGGTYLFADNFTLTGGDHDNVTLFGDGPSTCFKLSDHPNTANVEAGWMCMLTGTASAPLVGFRSHGIQWDGRKAETAWATTSYGIVAYPDAVLEDCQVEASWFHDFRTSGVQWFVGGLRAALCWSNDNTAHGFGVSIDNTFGDAFAELYACTATGNAGYGFDLAAGKVKASGLLATGNTFGGGKTTNLCEYLSLTDALFEDNDGVGWGHTTDGSLQPELHYDNITCRGNGRRGMMVLAASDASTFGTISCVGNGLITPDSSDLQFGDTGEPLYRFSATLLSTEGSGNDRGILIDGDVTDYSIGAVFAKGSASQGFEDTCTGPTRGQVGTMHLVNCNQDATAGANGAAVEVNRAGSFTVGSAIFEDTQGSPTQTGAFYFASGCVGTVTKASFGTGIATPYYVASNGTVILHENAWTALRSVSATTTALYTDDTILVDATGAARTVNLPAATNQTGKRYTVKKIDASANAVTVDPSGAETIDGAGTYALTVQYQSVTCQSDGTTWWVL